MTQEKLTTSPALDTGETTPRRANIVVRLFHAFVSFVVGLAAFFVIKALFMLPLNLMATERNIDLIKGLGALLFLVSVFLAVRYTKKLNRSGTPKGRLVKRILTLIAGFVAMALSNAALLLAQAAR